MKLVFRKSFWNDCSEPERQNHFLTFLFSPVGGGVWGGARQKIERKWFWSGGRTSGASAMWRGGVAENYYRVFLAYAEV